MDDWQVNRLKINRDVRSALISANVNLDRLSVNVYPDRIYFRGHLELSGSSMALDPIAVSNIFQDILRVPGVKRIVSHLENWENDGDLVTWRPIGDSPQVKKRKPPASGDGGEESYELD